MKKTRFLISFLIIALLMFSGSSYGRQRYKFNPDKPFAGKFKGKVEQDGTVYKVVYILAMDSEGNITGNANTYLNGIPVLSTTVIGKVNEDGISADVTLPELAPYVPTLVPSNEVRIKLRGTGKKGVKMQYLVDGLPVGDVIKYKRKYY